MRSKSRGRPLSATSITCATLKYGPDVEVLAPASLRAKVAAQLAGAAPVHGCWPLMYTICIDQCR